MLPDIRILSGPVRLMAIKVESVVDFLVAHQLTGIESIGRPFASVRVVKITVENGVEFWIVELFSRLSNNFVVGFCLLLVSENRRRRRDL